MVENYNSMDLAAFKNVWVFCEQRQGKMMPTTFELISEGRKLADELGVQLSGILLLPIAQQEHHPAAVIAQQQLGLAGADARIQPAAGRHVG